MSQHDPDAITLRPMAPGDAPAMLAFARALPPHDLLFLQRDIRSERVVAAWIEQIAQGLIRSLVAVGGDAVIGCVAIVRDRLSWSAHVAELRVLVSPQARGSGLGRRLAEEGFALAVADDGVDKVTVRLVPDQAAAIALFEEMGFRGEAMLRDQVRDSDGATHDLAILSLDVMRQGGQHRAFGLGELS